MKKRWVAWGAGWGTAVGAAILVMRDSYQSMQKMEALGPAPAKTVPTTSNTELAEAIRRSGNPLRSTGRDGDVNEDGYKDLDDILLVLAAFSSPYDCEWPCLEDICCAGKNKVDVDDLIAVLKACAGETELCPCQAATARRATRRRTGRVRWATRR